MSPRSWLIRPQQDVAKLLDNVRRMILEAGERDLLLTLDLPKRTNPQNARMWVLLQQAANAGPKSAEQWHQEFKAKYIGFDELDIDGVIFRIPHSTTKLNKKQFAEYVDKVEAHLAHEGYIGADRWTA